MLTLAVGSFGNEMPRVATLVNVAVALAQRGQRVVCSSFEPQPYFVDRLLCQGDDRQLKALREAPGLYDLVSELAAAVLSTRPDDLDVESRQPPQENLRDPFGGLPLGAPSSHVQRLATLAADVSSLRLLRGGPLAFGRPTPLHPIRGREDWSRLVARWGGEIYFEYLRADLSNVADLLLMDCGNQLHTEPAKTFIAESADALLITSTYDNVETAPLYHFLDRESPYCGLPKRPLAVLPVPVDVGSEERELLEQGRGNFAYNFDRFLPEGVGSDFFSQAEIPRVPFYEKAERIALLDADTQKARLLSAGYRHVASVIERFRTQWQRPPRSSQELAVAYATLPARRWWDVFLSYSSEDLPEARRLRDALARAGLRTFLAEDDIVHHIGTDPWSQAIDSVLQRSRTLLVLYSPGARTSRWVKQEYTTFLRERATAGDRRVVVPMCLGGLRPGDLPEELQEFQAVILRDPLGREALTNSILTLLGDPVWDGPGEPR